MPQHPKEGQNEPLLTPKSQEELKKLVEKPSVQTTVSDLQEATVDLKRAETEEVKIEKITAEDVKSPGQLLTLEEFLKPLPPELQKVFIEGLKQFQGTTISPPTQTKPVPLSHKVLLRWMEQKKVFHLRVDNAPRKKTVTLQELPKLANGVLKDVAFQAQALNGMWWVGEVAIEDHLVGELMP